MRLRSKEKSDTPSKSILFGAENEGPSYHFEGRVKHVGTWGRRLYPEEMKQLIEQFTNNLKMGQWMVE